MERAKSKFKANKFKYEGLKAILSHNLSSNSEGFNNNSSRLHILSDRMVSSLSGLLSQIPLENKSIIISAQEIIDSIVMILTENFNEMNIIKSNFNASNELINLKYQLNSAINEKDNLLKEFESYKQIKSLSEDDYLRLNSQIEHIASEHKKIKEEYSQNNPIDEVCVVLKFI